MEFLPFANEDYTPAGFTDSPPLSILPLTFQGIFQATPVPVCALASPDPRGPRISGPALSGPLPMSHGGEGHLLGADPPRKARRPHCARSRPKRSGLTPHPQGLSQLDISQGAHWACGSLAAGSVH